MGAPIIDEDKLLTSHQVGVMLQVNPSSINKWVNEGRITAFRTPGGHRRIKVKDLLVFLTNHHMAIPRELDAVRKRLLVVDDNEKYLAALKRAMKPFSSRIDARFVENGIDALIQVGSFRPHLIVLDVLMPGLDGIEVCKRLKADPDLRNIMVVVTSAQLTEDIEKKAAAAGAVVSLRKPFDLFEVVRHLGIEQQTTART